LIYPNNICVRTTSTKDTVTRVITTAPVVLVPTSLGPPLVVRPYPQAIIDISNPKTTDLIIMDDKSELVKLTLPERTEVQKTMGGTL
tara:strand:+ start:236 stop:496 length:261 start_codon:yes stop_codon:yes gene_type:complete